MKRFSIILRRATPQASRGERRSLIVRVAPPIEEAHGARGGPPCRCFGFEMFIRCKQQVRELIKWPALGGTVAVTAQKSVSASRLEKIVVYFEKLDYVFAIFANEIRSNTKI